MGDERLSWLDRWWLYRDRLIASPRVQRWALANPLTRPVAQRRARGMLDLCAGFVYSQALFTCVRLRLFDILFKGPLTIAALAERLLLSPEATSRLLDAAVSLGLAERRGRSVYGLGQLGAALAGNRAALSLIEHQPLLYADLQDPVALLRGSPRGTGIARYWPYSAATHPTELTAPMPDGADVISLIRIVHDHDDASAVTLLRAVHRALPPNGTLLIAEAMSGVGGAEPLDAYYGFYTLAMGRGEPRTVAEISRLLRQAGFSRFRLLRNRMPILTSILVARRTSS